MIFFVLWLSVVAADTLLVMFLSSLETLDDEPIMEGSDDDFEDLVLENKSYEDSQQDTSIISPTDLPNSPVQSPPISTSLLQTPIPSIPSIQTPIQSPPISTSLPQTSPPIITSLPQAPIPSTQTSTVWSTNLHPVVIYPFTGTVGATFPVTNVPSEIFSHFFLQMICFI